MYSRLFSPLSPPPPPECCSPARCPPMSLRPGPPESFPSLNPSLLRRPQHCWLSTPGTCNPTPMPVQTPPTTSWLQGLGLVRPPWRLGSPLPLMAPTWLSIQTELLYQQMSLGWLLLKQGSRRLIFLPRSMDFKTN